MVDPVIYSNPYAPSVRTETFPSGRSKPYLVNCRVCKLKKVPYVWAPHHRAFQTKCLNCGTPHVWKMGDKSLHEIQIDGAYVRAGPEGEYKGSTYIDATKRVEEAHEKRTLGKRYWRR